MTGLAEKAASVSPRRMGRNPLEESASDTKPVPVRIGPDLRARIDEARGATPVAKFIREAVERELERRGK
jgi:hypothetical protein